MPAPKGNKFGKNGGRPSKYSLELAKEICKLIAHGKSVVSICQKEGMPNYTTVRDWIANNEEFSNLYARAKEDQADYLAEEIIAIADDSSEDELFVDTNDGSAKRVQNSEFINRSRLRVDTRKWIASKLKPKKYGDRMQVAGDSDAPLTIRIKSNVEE